MTNEEQAKVEKNEREPDQAIHFSYPTSTSMLPPSLNLKKLESIQRLLRYGAIVILFVFIVLIVVSYFELNDTVRRIAQNEEQLKTQSKELEEQSNTLSNQKAELDKSKIKLANQQDEVKRNEENIARQKEEIEKQQKLIDSFQEATRSVSEKNPAQGEELRQALESKISQNFGGQQTPARIYIQIFDEAQRARATDIARRLQKMGYLLPGIENVGVKSIKFVELKISELRSCRSDDAARQDIARITDALASLSVKLNEPRFLGNCGNARARQYELWFGSNF